MPFFSVIIPVYNKAMFIEQTLKSVFAQTFIDFELIVVNDGSTDKSEVEILAFNDERMRYFVKENGGASTARNFGIEMAEADYITFLDADDYWYPDFLQEMFRNIGKFPEQKIFAAAIEIEMPKAVFPAQYSIEKNTEPQVVGYFGASEKTTAICTSCAVFHKSIFEEIGNFDIHLKSGQDTDLWIRMGLFYPVVFSSTILARYVYDPKSLSKNVVYLTKKLDFSKFAEAEKTNRSLKKFLDLNRFSFAIKCRLIGDFKHFRLYRDDIDPENLSGRKKILLLLPGSILRFLLKFNLLLVRYGISKSAFK